MNRDRMELIFFFLFVVAVLALNFFVFQPYFSILFLALVFSIIFYPLYEYLHKFFGGRGTVAALVSVFLIFLIIVGPLSFIAALLLNEATALYHSVIGLTPGTVPAGPLADFAHGLNTYFPSLPLSDIETSIQSYAATALAWFLNNASGVFSGVLLVAFDLFLMLISLFYFFRDGKKFVRFLVEASPLSDSADHKIFDHVVTAIISVIGGSIVVAIVEGALLGAGFAIFGLPSPVLFGAAAAVAAFIPILGPSIIFVPAAAFLFFSSGPIFAIGLALWGFVIAGFMGSIVGPYIMNRGIRIHPLLVLFSVLGGLSYFGMIGFLAGPVLLSVMFALLDIYPMFMSSGAKRSAPTRKLSRLF